MDWKSLTSKLDPLMTKIEPYTKKLDPYIDRAKDAGYKALDFTQKQLQNTPIVLKSLEEYTLLRTSKRAILIAYDESDPLSREIVLRSPVWSAQAWSDAAELRYIEISSAPDIVRTLGITTPLDMHIWYTGIETYHATDLEEIKKWWKTRCYDGKLIDNEELWMDNEKSIKPIQESEITISDPLAGK